MLVDSLVGSSVIEFVNKSSSRDIMHVIRSHRIDVHWEMNLSNFGEHWTSRRLVKLLIKKHIPQETICELFGF
jgi:hypothetical protein